MGELAVLDGGAPVRSSVNLIEVARQAEAAKNLGATLIKSGLLPQSITKPEQAMAIMLTAQELNLPVMYALKNITVIQGTPAPSEQCIGLLVRRAGHKLRVVEATNERCTVEGVRADDPNHAQRVTFDIEDARRAGLLNKNPWKNYPRAMLRARAKTELCRGMFEDALAGLSYVAEELGADVNEDGEVLSVPDRGAPTQPAEEPVEEDAEVVEDRGGEEVEAALRLIDDLLADWPAGQQLPTASTIRGWASRDAEHARKAVARVETLRRDAEERAEAEEADESPESAEEIEQPDGDEPVPDFGDMRGAAQNASAPQKARKSQTDLIRTLAEEFHGEQGVAHIQKRVGKLLSELTREEANALIDELSPEDAR